MNSLQEWDDSQFSAQDCEWMERRTIATVTYGHVEGFQYDAITIHFDDGSELVIAPWDYEGYSAGLEKKWVVT